MGRICIDARKIGDFGIGSYVSQLLASLASIDDRHEYLVLTHPSRLALVDGLGPSFHPIATAAREYSVAELVALSWHVHRASPDLFHAPHYVLPASLPCPTVVTIHDVIHLLFPRFLPGRLAGAYARTMIRRALRRATRVIAVSESTRRDLEQVDAGAGDKIRVVHNGIAELFRQPPGEDRVGDRPEVARTGPYFLFVGNPKPHKNLGNLLRAWRWAQSGMASDTRLICVGAKDGTPLRLERLRTKLGLDETVSFLGHVDDAQLAALYRGAVALIHPSLYEGFGLPVAEAMATGTPVITSANSSLAEIAGDAACLIDPLDLHQISEAIVRLETDAELRRDLGARGRQRSADFRWQRAARETLAVYDEAMTQAS